MFGFWLVLKYYDVMGSMKYNPAWRRVKYYNEEVMRRIM